MIESGLPICATEQLGPVFDGHYGVPSVDEVEVVLGMEPRAFDVVDHELDVGWYPCRLNGGEVDAKHSCRRILISHFALLAWVFAGGGR